MANEVFISYSSKEVEQASLVRTVLQSNGISCWMAPESIAPGTDYASEIPKGIEECKVLVLLLSEASQTSQWVPKEVGSAISQKKIIIPFVISKCDVMEPFKFMLSNVQRIEAYEEMSKHLEILVKNIKAVIDKTPSKEDVVLEQGTEPSEPIGDEEELGTVPEGKKVSSVTGDVTYTLYGKEYTENQSDMMLRVFAQVLKRHQDKVDTLPQQDGMNCAAKYEDIEQPGTSSAKPVYFRTCANFEFDNGSAVCIGTSYSSGDKMKKIANLLKICGEDRNVFWSEQLELPEAGRSRSAGSGVEYVFYGQKYSGDQTEMMCHVCSTVIEKHPEKLAELVDSTLCIGYNDSSIDGKTYFRVSRIYNVVGHEYRIGTSFGMGDKMKQIAKVFAICGENSNILQVEGHEFVVKSVKEKSGKSGREKKNFMD